MFNDSIIDNSYINLVETLTDFNTGNGNTTAISNNWQRDYYYDYQMNDSNISHQRKDLNQQLSIRSMPTLAILNDNLRIDNNRENIPPEDDSEDEQKQYKGRGPVVLKYVNNAIKRSQTKYKRSKNISSKVFSNLIYFIFISELKKFILLL